MRNAFAQAMIQLAAQPDRLFLTGDLGFMALEGVRDAFGSRFINMGVAEQNMVGVAAGLARQGFQVFAYSIAPFCYARPFEQIRNDLCLSHLPVCLVGNGGGYAYGYMGPTHHALEDCAAMQALGVRVLAPAFDSDLPAQIAHIDAPTYLRLGLEIRPDVLPAPAYAPWRRLLEGQRGVVIALGPLAGLAWSALRDRPAAERPAVWAACEFDLATLPPTLCQAIHGQPLFILEEHVAAGGLGTTLALHLLKLGCHPSHVGHRTALGYPDGRFGSQAFHRAQCGLDAAGLDALIQEAP